MALEVQNLHHYQHQQGHDSGGEASIGGGSHPLVSGSSLAGLKRAIPVTLDLFHTTLLPSSHIHFKEPSFLLGWKNFLNLKTGETKMSHRNGNGPKLDLQLNLSPPRGVNNPRVNSPSQSATRSPTSPPSSCVSSEMNRENSPEITSMVLVGCPRCLMYVMLSEEDPKCPKCKSTVLLDFLHDINNMTKKTRN